MCDSPATGPDGNQDRLKSLSKILARQPSGVHQPEIVNASHLEALKQFLSVVVHVGVAVFHVKPLAGEFDRADPSVNSEQEQVATIQGLHRDERIWLSLRTCRERKQRAPNQCFREWHFVCVL
jgi:hypothetical protein